VYCGCDSETTIALPRDLRSDGYTKPYMGGDAVYNSAWITDTKSGSVNNYATSVGPTASRASGNFRSLYRRLFPSFFKSPGIQAYDSPAYDAAAIELTAIYQAAAKGETQVLVGTHALIQESISFADLGLAITDEQHRFGVEQRATLRAKGLHPTRWP